MPAGAFQTPRATSVRAMIPGHVSGGRHDPPRVSTDADRVGHRDPRVEQRGVLRHARQDLDRLAHLVGGHREVGVDAADAVCDEERVVALAERHRRGQVVRSGPARQAHDVDAHGVQRVQAGAALGRLGAGEPRGFDVSRAVVPTEQTHRGVQGECGAQVGVGRAVLHQARAAHHREQPREDAGDARLELFGDPHLHVRERSDHRALRATGGHRGLPRVRATHGIEGQGHAFRATAGRDDQEAPCAVGDRAGPVVARGDLGGEPGGELLGGELGVARRVHDEVDVAVGIGHRELHAVDAAHVELAGSVLQLGASIGPIATAGVTSTCPSDSAAMNESPSAPSNSSWSCAAVSAPSCPSTVPPASSTASSVSSTVTLACVGVVLDRSSHANVSLAPTGTA